MAYHRNIVEQIEGHGKALYRMTAPYRVNVPVGKSGPWQIDKFETKPDLGYMRYSRDGREPGIGEFTRLSHAVYGVVMSDTVAEINDLRLHLHDLKGDVLITGLGIGMVVHALTKIKELSAHVKSITAIEASEDVMKLSAEHYRKSDKRVTIIQADGYEWVPPAGTKYDSAWHDVWNDITTDNKAAFARMRRHYQRYMRTPKRQFIWGEAFMKADERRYG